MDSGESGGHKGPPLQNRPKAAVCSSVNPAYQPADVGAGLDPARSPDVNQFWSNPTSPPRAGTRPAPTVLTEIRGASDEWALAPLGKLQWLDPVPVHTRSAGQPSTHHAPHSRTKSCRQATLCHRIRPSHRTLVLTIVCDYGVMLASARRVRLVLSYLRAEIRQKEGLRIWYSRHDGLSPVFSAHQWRLSIH